ncbi:MAG: amidohydrolase family protein [Phycisphaerae bacterium]
MDKIDLHTHILPETFPDYAEKFGYDGFVRLDHHQPCRARMMVGDRFFREIEDNSWSPLRRLEDCAAHGVTTQVLSTIPVMFSYWAKAADTLEVARFLNDHIAEIVREHPGRFEGLATVPMQDPELACRELERCVRDLGLRGMQIGTHINGWNLHEPVLFPVFEVAAKIGAAIFVHPWDMMGAHDMPKYWLPWLVGMPAETSRAICSVIFGGVLERLPDLRIAFAHGGGSFPATIGRIEHGFIVRPDLCAVDNPHNPRKYLRQRNGTPARFFVDSLVHDAKMMHMLLDLFGEQRICLGTDYPFPLGELEPGKLVETMDELSDEVKRAILAGAAREFLGIGSTDTR